MRRRRVTADEARQIMFDQEAKWVCTQISIDLAAGARRARLGKASHAESEALMKRAAHDLYLLEMGHFPDWWASKR